MARLRIFDLRILFALGLLLLGACAFDVVSLHSIPTTLTPANANGPRLVLQTGLQPKLVSGWVSPLKPHTTWQKVGQTPQGDVYRTKDQILTVEASNLYQADMVVKDGEVIGFYIPTGLVFTPCSHPLKIDLSEII